MSLLMNKTIREFSEVLASKEPAPGGGSTSALSGLLATSLTMMVINLTIGKKSFELLDKSIKNKVAEDFEVMKKLNIELDHLVDEDTKAFLLFMEAMKLPKTTEEERSIRLEALQSASVYALNVPLSVAEKCLLVLKHQLVIAEYGNRNAVSDVGVGALMAQSGLEGAVLNVKINLPSIVDEELKRETQLKIEDLVLEGIQLNSEIIKTVNRRIEEA